jgi:hypothetical protein
MQQKFKSLGVIDFEFQVFFNDSDANDFNTLFKGLPSQRQYMAVGVPGSFYGKLFPRGSMNFMNSAYANHWLSKVPDEVTTEGSQAWNKCNITYAGSSEKVVEAYRAQFFKDMDTFLRARSLELADDGLLSILMPCRVDGTHPSNSLEMNCYNFLGYALYEMAKEGMVSEALVDSFNLPIFFPSLSEVRDVVSTNHELSIEVLEDISNPVNRTDMIKSSSLHIRAVYENILVTHFGSEGIDIDDLFIRFAQKFDELLKVHADVKAAKLLFLLVKKKNGN